MKRQKGISIDEIAEIAGGIVSGVSSDKIRGANTLENAQEGEISFLANPKYKKWLDCTGASCVIVSRGLKTNSGKTLIKVDDPAAAFSKVIIALYGEKSHPVRGRSIKASISSTAKIAKTAKVGDHSKIGRNVSVGSGTVVYPNVYIGDNTVIGKNCVVYPNVSILDNVSIGDRVYIQSGSVIGSDGFGYSTENGVHKKIPQIGRVIIESDVELGSNVCIDRGSPGDTFIGTGTKLDNLVQVAHNVKIGKNCLICAQAGIAGSTVIEDNVVLAGQAGVVGHITIGMGAQVGAQAGVTRNVKSGAAVSGYPATEHSRARKINALIKKLPQLAKDLEELKKKSR
jgi:UDP-3-O-[3-hydroxymyristoyl] glucosamine N-acyltransferase